MMVIQMHIKELSRDELRVLKQNYAVALENEGKLQEVLGIETTSYLDTTNIDKIVLNETIFTYYDGITFKEDDLTSMKDCEFNSRTMTKSVGKFLIFQLIVNISTLLIPILGWTKPFSIIEILWINLIMDTLATIIFGSKPILNRFL